MILNIIKHIRKHGLKQTYKDWKLNFYILQTPELITKQHIQGSIAMMIGLLLIVGVLTMRKEYLFLVAIGAGLFMNYVSLKTFLLQRRALIKLKEEFEEVGI